MKKPILFLGIILVTQTSNTLPATAKWGQFTITDDNGEEVVVKHGLFGKKVLVKDRNGDGFQSKKSIFGLTKDTQVSAVGNDFHTHKGLFGFGKTEGQDMLGDTVTSKKNLLYRNTNVNLSGANNLFNKYFGPPKTTSPALNPNYSNNPGSIPALSGGQSPVSQPIDANSQTMPAPPVDSQP